MAWKRANLVFFRKQFFDWEQADWKRALKGYGILPIRIKGIKILSTIIASFAN